MKIIIKKIFKAVGSRMTYLLVGLSFSVVVIAVNAAVTITSTDAISGSTLTKAKWDAMVNDLENIRDEVNGQAIECTTKSAPVQSCSGDACNGSVNCDAGWVMTGGGCLANMHCWYEYLEYSFPTSDNTGWQCSTTYSGCSGSFFPGTVYARCCR